MVVGQTCGKRFFYISCAKNNPIKLMRTQIRLQKLGHTPRKIAKSNGILFCFVFIRCYCQIEEKYSEKLSLVGYCIGEKKSLVERPPER